MTSNRLRGVLRRLPLLAMLASLALSRAGPAAPAPAAGREAAPPAPVIERFDSNARMLPGPSYVRLCFRVRNASRLTIDGGPGPPSTSEGCVSRFVAATTTFKLTASGAGEPAQKATASVTVTVERESAAGAARAAPPTPPPAPPVPTRSIAPPGAPAATAAIPTFPWPPPAASAEHQIRNAWVTKGDNTKLSDVAEKLEVALEDADYETWRYSSVPHGFALATQIEQIRPDGTPRSGKDRFRMDLPSFGDMTFVEFLKALAKAPPGYYRVIVFVVTDTPFSRSDRAPTEQEAQEWLRTGLNQLPRSIGALPYGADYRSTALVYEFRKPSKDSPATFVPKSAESGRLHLERAGIWDALTR